ncbi:glucosamine-fructose-6-phosphate aminotransferase, partial [Enterococcus faecalis]
VVDELLDLKMGLETVGFVTKGYTTTLLNLLLFGLKLGYQKHQLTKVVVEEELAKLAKAFQEVDSVIYITEQFWQKPKNELKEG